MLVEQLLSLLPGLKSYVRNISKVPAWSGYTLTFLRSMPEIVCVCYHIHEEHGVSTIRQGWDFISPTHRLISRGISAASTLCLWVLYQHWELICRVLHMVSLTYSVNITFTTHRDSRHKGEWGNVVNWRGVEREGLTPNTYMYVYILNRIF